MGQSNREKEEVRWLISQEIPALRRYARVLLGNNENLDDLVQDTLERAIRKSHTWRREGEIRSWLYRVQYRIFLNRYRRAATSEVPDQDMMDSVAIQPGLGQERQFELKNVMGSLSRLRREQREVILMIAVEGLSYDQVARIMDVPVGTVRSRLARAREEMRRAFRRGDVGPRDRDRDSGRDDVARDGEAGHGSRRVIR